MFVKDENFPLLAVEKLLVHLTEYPELGDMELHPRETTQEGISEVIGVSRPTATKLLKKLYKAGLVRYTRRIRVKGMDTRRRTYHLTDKGRAKAVHVSAIVAGIPATAPESEEEQCPEPLGIGATRFGGTTVPGRRPLPNLR